MAEQRVRSVFQDLYPPDQPAEMEMRAELKRIVEAVACQAIFLGAPFCSVGAAASQSGADGPLTLTTSQLRVKIDQASAAAEKPLSLEARAARQRSLTRFYNATAALCGAQDQCLHNEYYNYLAQVPRSVYRVDGHLVYETGVYGLLWADERLQQQDPERPFTWDLRVTWPLIDEPGDPSGPMERARGARAGR